MGYLYNNIVVILIVNLKIIYLIINTILFFYFSTTLNFFMKASCMRRQKICDVALVPSSSTLSYHQIQDTLLQEIIYIYI